MDDVSLHPALQPAGALTSPIAEGFGSLLPRCGGQGSDAYALPCQPDAEVRILGDIVGIPAAGGFQYPAREMVGRAAKRNRQVEPRQRRHNGIEQSGIFYRELAGERYSGANAPDIKMNIATNDDICGV